METEHDAAQSGHAESNGALAATTDLGALLPPFRRPRPAARAALGAVGNPQMIKNAVTRLCLPGEPVLHAQGLNMARMISWRVPLRPDHVRGKAAWRVLAGPDDFNSCLQVL